MAIDASDPHDPWPAPTGKQPVHATVRIPGSKSATNRALMLAGLADGPSRVDAALDARDTALMVRALTALGVGFERLNEESTTATAPDPSGNCDWQITPASTNTQVNRASIDVGLAGTVMRFLPPMAALTVGDITMDGDQRARERPLGPMLAALTGLGVELTSAGGFLPLRIQGRGRVLGGSATIDASASSQFISGLLLSAARFDEGLALSHLGTRLPSQPHIDMTVQMLAEHGVEVSYSAVATPTWSVEPGPIRACDRVIEPDLSNAAPFLAAAMVTGGEVTISDWPTHTTQAGDQLRELLTQMGARVDRVPAGLRVRAGTGVHGIDVDLGSVGELTPVIAALCALADGPSHLRGIGHLRGHETDRLAALAEMLGQLGGDVRENADGITIHPKPLHGATVDSYHDHRMATAAAVLGLAIPDIHIHDIATTRKTLPDFPQMWTHMLATTA